MLGCAFFMDSIHLMTFFFERGCNLLLGCIQEKRWFMRGARLIHKWLLMANLGSVKELGPWGAQ